MTRNPKALGLALVAVFAMSGLISSSASAHYRVTTESAHIHGTQTTNVVLKTSVGSMTCKKATFTKHTIGTKGELGYTTPKLAVHPTYSECAAFGFNATFKTNACDYEFQEPASKAAAVKIVNCAAGAPMELVLTGFCTMTFGNQSTSGTVAFTNEGSGSTADVKAAWGVTGISYAGNCGSGSSGTMEGSATFKAYTSEAMTTQVGFSVN